MMTYPLEDRVSISDEEILGISVENVVELSDDDDDDLNEENGYEFDFCGYFFTWPHEVI